MGKPIFTATCACGGVEFRAVGAPIATAVCYCADCQKGGAQIEALPNAVAVRDADGGTAYMLFRKDRIACSKGAEHLKPYRLKERSITSRVVAACCNSAMVMRFDRGPHWVSAYRARFHEPLPPLQFRICTKSKREDVTLPNDVPSSAGYPPALVPRLLASWVAMRFGR
ncbi:MAG: hypothetical protein E7774_09830 [Bradyrhizobium sp.]|nr:MAG: hypothetical protein E7774_09830 [Bradyrhizobium sp.]